MPLNIKNVEVETLIDEVVALTGESKTEAVKKALLERKAKLDLTSNKPKAQRLLAFLKNEVWPHLPDELRSKGISQEEQDEILGYGPDGV